MRLTFTLLFVLFFSFLTSAQKITGIWRGYFVQQEGYNPVTGEFIEDRYKYEVQLNQLDNDALEGVTYSYKSTIFYGKSSIHGIYKANTKNVLIKEIKMLDLKIADQAVACLMTCYLDYSKSGNLETLSGTYTSISNNPTRSDCGSGTLYLEKVTNSDFVKEPFLLKKANHKSSPGKQNKDSITVKTAVPKSAPAPVKPIAPLQDRGSLSKPSTGNSVKPGTESFIISKSKPLKKDSSSIPQTLTHSQTLKDSVALPLKPDIVSKSPTPLPKELIERKSPLIRTIELDENLVQLDYYDNGEIDNDTITVYHNNQLEVDHGRLSDRPITLKLKVDKDHPLHEIITVANNLGDIPPNTALMVITAGKKRYEVFIASDEQTNAKVIIKYKPGPSVQVLHH